MTVQAHTADRRLVVLAVLGVVLALTAAMWTLAGCAPTRPCRAGARAHDAPCPSPPSSQRRAKASSTGR